ncbi:P34 probable thiol protease-like [Prosopis cineraria]|uniref:P34 probable thiol protease-like n=1 Tax=Prosopis cineraria TaxID=364024 RepID=UPI00240F17E3|nr:P34 probable thiol protease-like [Prosopis cineraria]
MTSLISKSLFLLVFLFFSNICLSFSIPSEYPILSDDDVDKLDKFTSEEDIRELFRMWQKKYEREYGSRDEKENRFEIFKSNLKYIVEKNSKTTSYRLGLNQFSDLAFEEFSKTYLGHQQPEKLIAATIDGYVNKTYKSESALFCAAAKQPVSISVNVTRDFSYYQQGVFDDIIIHEERPCRVNHAVLLVGYRSIFGQRYWIVKNSWGHSWGQDLHQKKP